MKGWLEQIDKAQPGKTTVLELKQWNSLPQYFMEKIAAKSNCDFVLKITYNKKNYEINIPAGTVFDTNFKWFGPEKLIEMFGGKEIN